MRPYQAGARSVEMHERMGFGRRRRKIITVMF